MPLRVAGLVGPGKVGPVVSLLPPPPFFFLCWRRPVPLCKNPRSRASSSQSTPFGASHSAYRDELRIPELEPYRDEAGFLPLVPCSKCGTLLIGRVSHKEGSKGKRFYKCPLLEHVSCGGIASLFWMRFFVDFFISGLQTDYACRTYYFEEHYVPLLVSKGVLPRHFSQLEVVMAWGWR